MTTRHIYLIPIWWLLAWWGFKLLCVIALAGDIMGVLDGQFADPVYWAFGALGAFFILRRVRFQGHRE